MIADFLIMCVWLQLRTCKVCHKPFSVALIDSFFLLLLLFSPPSINWYLVLSAADDEIKIHFDGWGPEYDYWCSSDSVEIHPIGWCRKHSWELQPPLRRWQIMVIVVHLLY